MTTAVSLLVQHLWQSTLVSGGAALLVLLLKSNSARIRYAVWLAASLKFFVPFAALMALGTYWSGSPASKQQAQVVLFVRTRGLAAPQPPLLASTIHRMAPPRALPARMVGLNLPAGSPTTEDPPVARASSRMVLLLTGVWAVGVLIQLTLWIVRWRRIRELVHATRRIEAGREVAVLRHLEGMRRGGKRVQLRMTGEAVEPGVFGILKPVLIWPEGISARLSDEEVSAILVHELSHVERRDNLTAAVHMLVQAIFWFHPLVWWLGARLFEERERACDESVIQAGVERRTYAQGVLKACRFGVESPAVCVTGAGGSDLPTRIEQIMRSAPATRLTGWKQGLLATVAGAALVVPVALGAMSAPTQIRSSSARVVELHRFLWRDPREVFTARAVPELADTTPLAFGELPSLAFVVRPEGARQADDARHEPRDDERATSVTLTGRLARDGVPTSLVVRTPAEAGLAQLALDTVARWRFEPTLESGMPTTVPLKVTLAFGVPSSQKD